MEKTSTIVNNDNENYKKQTLEKAIQESEQDMFGNRLKKIRKKKKLSLQDLCEKISDCGFWIDKSTLALYEQGKRAPKLESLKYISLALDVSVDYLVGNTNYPIVNVEDKILCRVTGLDETVISALRKSVEHVRIYKRNCSVVSARNENFISLHNLINLFYDKNNNKSVFNILIDFLKLPYEDTEFAHIQNTMNENMVAFRLKHEAIERILLEELYRALIKIKCDFYGRDFFSDNDVPLISEFTYTPQKKKSQAKKIKKGEINETPYRNETKTARAEACTKVITGIQNAQAGHTSDAIIFIDDLEKKLNEQDKQGKEDKQ